MRNIIAVVLLALGFGLSVGGGAGQLRPGLVAAGILLVLGTLALVIDVDGR